MWQLEESLAVAFSFVPGLTQSRLCAGTHLKIANRVRSISTAWSFVLLFQYRQYKARNEKFNPVPSSFFFFGVGGWLQEQLGECLYVLEGHKEHVTGVARLDGRRLASCSSDGTLRVWDLNTGKTLHDIDLTSPANCLGAAGQCVVACEFKRGSSLQLSQKKTARALPHVL